jgi:glyoxylase-like metal-dependent hydrolase (beta-lactamase superfamily II)
VRHTLSFDRSHPGHYGACIQLSPLVRRVVANNPGPMTFTGTVTHIVGRGDVAVIDPGPDDGDHLIAIMAATAGETITHIFATHTHRDHVDGVEALHAATGARIVGCSPYDDPSAATPQTVQGYHPDQVLSDLETLGGSGWTLQALATPGHTANHLAFVLQEEASLFPGDLVMAWSTTVIAPPSGDMRAYKASLRRLLGRPERTYYPAHGPSLADAKPYVQALLDHRLQREQQIVDAVALGARTVDDLVGRLYPSVSPSLKNAAGMSVLAHLAELVDDGRLQRNMDGTEPSFSRI